MGFFIVAILQTEEAFKELELDLQLKYKARYRRSISAGLIFESILKASVNRRLTAALEEGNGKTPGWLQWEEEQTLNGIKERRKQLHTEMASVQRWVHISRKYTCILTKIHEGSKKQSLSWGIQKASRRSQTEEKGWSGDRTLAFKHGFSVYGGPGCTQGGWHEATQHHTQSNQPTGAPSRISAAKVAANANVWSSYQGWERWINEIKVKL